MSTAPSLTLVVPTFNEAARLDDGMVRLRDADEHGAVDLSTTEVLFVDDGSTDDTASAARRHAGALANARVTSPIAVGSRAVNGHVDYGSRLRTEAGRAFNRAVRAVGGVVLDDTQCGFKGFRRGTALLLSQLQTTRGYAFDVELLWLASRLDLDVTIVPVTWLDVPGSSVRVLRDSTRMLADLVMVRRRSRWLAVVDLDEDWQGPSPTGAVVVRRDDRRLLCGAVSDLGALRRGVRAAGRPRLLALEDLVALAPFECVPAPRMPANS